MFLPESIDLGQSEKYVLSIRIKAGGFMFSIVDPAAPKNYCLRETSFSEKDNLLSNVQRIVFELGFLTQEYKQTNVVFVSKDYDLIPADYFDKNRAGVLYDYTHFDKSSHILYGLTESQDVITQYNVNKDLYDFLCRSLWNPIFHHHSILLSNLIANYKSNATSAGICICFHDNIMDVFCLSGSKLLYCQTYENEPTENQIYYILKLWERFDLNQKQDYLHIIWGDSEAFVNKITLYINNIQTIGILDNIRALNTDTQKAPLDLLTLSL